jgi:5,10-methylenetetrahydromethanopterin reductase
MTAPIATAQVLPEVGFYGLAGHAPSPADLIGEVAYAERLGLGAVFLSERFNTKDAAVLAGAAAAVSERIGIASAATNHNTRHPLVTATMATTLHRLSAGRYSLGLGRGFDLLFDLMGLPRVTSAQLEDAIGIYRRLWHGEAVVGHDGPAGHFPYLSQDSAFHEDIPVILVAIGDATLRLAGRVADGVVLHTFLTDEALARAVTLVRSAAEEAGRNPAGVRIWSVLATVEDAVPEQIRLRKLAGRLATYLQGYGEVLVQANRWDPAELQRFRDDPFVKGFPGPFDAAGSVAELQQLTGLLPESWLQASATGSAQACAKRVLDQFDAGADSVILHGSTPRELAPVVEAWRAVRPADRFAGLPRNPGRCE